jgi:peptide/nickel transport system permease protein
MIAALLRRIGVSIGLAWIVASVVFLAIRLVPGDPAELLLSQGRAAPDPATVAELREALGLDRPVADAIFGQPRWPVARRSRPEPAGRQSGDAQEIAARLPRTLELIAAATVMATRHRPARRPAAALRPGGAFDRIASGIAALGWRYRSSSSARCWCCCSPRRCIGSRPAATCRWPQSPGRHIALLAMPAVTIALGLFAVVFRMTRSSVLDVPGATMSAPPGPRAVPPGVLVRHVAAQRADAGRDRAGTQSRHACSAAPCWSNTSSTIPACRACWWMRSNARDYPMVEGIVLVISLLFVAVQPGGGSALRRLDPRVRRMSRLSWLPGALSRHRPGGAAVPVLGLPDPVRMDVAHRLAHLPPPGWLGQDEYGRDVLSRLLWGARVSLAVACAASAAACVARHRPWPGRRLSRGRPSFWPCAAWTSCCASRRSCWRCWWSRCSAPARHADPGAGGALSAGLRARGRMPACCRCAAQDYVEAMRVLGAGPAASCCAPSCRISPDRSWCSSASPRLRGRAGERACRSSASAWCRRRRPGA